MIEEPIETVFELSSRKRRIAAFAIDHFVILVLLLSIILIVTGPSLMSENSSGQWTSTLKYVMTSGLLLYFAKDSIKGISIGKWIMGIIVRSEENPNETPSFARLLLRNLFIIIWPVEFFVLASNDQNKRIGDYVAKTMVIKKLNRPSSKPLRILALIGIGVLFFVSLSIGVTSVMKSSDAYKVATKEIEHNRDIINETGGIKGYGSMPEAHINMSNGQGQAAFELEVLGNRKDVTVIVYLEKKLNEDWKVIEIKR